MLSAWPGGFCSRIAAAPFPNPRTGRINQRPSQLGFACARFWPFNFKKSRWVEFDSTGWVEQNLVGADLLQFGRACKGLEAGRFTSF